MRFSVFNTGTRSYDYYASPGTPDIHAGAPARVMANALGATPDQASWRLPLGARKVGSGEMPIGRIASLGGDDTSPAPSMKTIAVGMVVSYFIWRALR